MQTIYEKVMTPLLETLLQFDFFFKAIQWQFAFLFIEEK